jgi:cell division septation protein DedD
MIFIASPALAEFGLSNIVEKEIATVPADPQKSNIITCDKKIFYPFTIHLSTWDSNFRATEEMSKLGSSMGAAFITKIDDKEKGALYRLDYGIFSEEKEATDKLAEMQKAKIASPEAFVGTTPYTIEMGVFTLEQDAVIQKIRLKGTNIVSYIIKESNGCYRVLVGAYPDKESARTTFWEIRSKGQGSNIAKR